jgi:hypothetical protein
MPGADMLDAEGKRRIFAQARDDEERQRLMVALWSDPATEAVRSLFELLAVYVVYVAIAFAGSAFVMHALGFAALGFKAVLIIGTGAFLAILLIINIRADVPSRAQSIRLAAAKYGYPIILATGLFGGWLYRGYTDVHSEEYASKHAALSACANLPACLSLARRFNSEVDVSQYLPPGNR